MLGASETRARARAYQYSLLECWVITEGRFSCVELQHHHSKCIHVSTSGQFLVAQELGGHVSHGAHQHLTTCGNCALTVSLAGQFSGQAEV